MNIDIKCILDFGISPDERLNKAYEYSNNCLVEMMEQNEVHREDSSN